jgi:hypothetical protein
MLVVGTILRELAWELVNCKIRDFTDTIAMYIMPRIDYI